MANLAVYKDHDYPKNGSGGSDDGRTYTPWKTAEGSADRTWLPPGSGETTPGSFIQTSTGDVWKFRKYFRFSSVYKLTRQSARLLNFHIIGGYPGYNSGLAFSPVALDAFRPGGDNNGINHAGPFLQFQVAGGGVFQTDSGSGTAGPANDGWYHGMSNSHFTYDYAYDTDYYIDWEMCFSPDPAVGSVKADISTGGVSSVWIPFQHLPTFIPAGSEAGGAGSFGTTGGVMGLQDLEGAYQATGAGSSGTLQDEFEYLATMGQFGKSSSAMISDTFTVAFATGLGVSSPLPGSGASKSSSVDTSTTVSDANFTSGSLTGGGVSGGGSPAPPSSISAVSSQFQGTDSGIYTFATATGKAEAVIAAALGAVNPNHLYSVHIFSDGSKYALCERPLSAPTPAANWWVAGG